MGMMLITTGKWNNIILLSQGTFPSICEYISSASPNSIHRFSPWNPNDHETYVQNFYVNDTAMALRVPWNGSICK